MRLEERRVKWCLMKNCEFGAEMTVSEWVKEQVLHWPMPQGNVPLGAEQFYSGTQLFSEFFSS